MPKLVHLLGLAATISAADTFNGTMYDYIAQSSVLSNLGKIANSEGYAKIKELLESDGNFTLFAPYDNATANIDIKDVEGTTATLQYHLLGFKVESAQLDPVQFPASLLTNTKYVNIGKEKGQVVHVTKKDKDVQILFGYGEAAQVTVADQICSNGIIHIIDHVLAIPSQVKDAAAVPGDLTNLTAALVKASLVDTVDTTEELTILAPNDDAFALFPAWENASVSDLTEILKFHVISGVVYSNGVTDGMTVPTLNGDNVTFHVDMDGGVSVTGGDITAQVRFPDYLTQNGVIHVIDKVLRPAPGPTPTPSPTTSSPTPRPPPAVVHEHGTLPQTVDGGVGLSLENVGIVGSGNGVMQRWEAGNWTVTEGLLPYNHTGFSGATLQGLYFLFAGGQDATTKEDTDSVLVINKEGVPEGEPLKLSQARAHFTGATAGGSAFFAGGLTYSSETKAFSPSDVVDIWFDKDTHKEDSLKEARGNLASAATDNFVLFAGGSTDENGGNFSSAVDVYDVQSKKFITTNFSLDTPRAFLAGVALDEETRQTFIFAGGLIADGLGEKATDDVEAFIWHKDTDKWEKVKRDPLSKARFYLSGTSANNWAVFAGGQTTADLKNKESDVVDLVDASDAAYTETLHTARALPAFFSVMDLDKEKNEQDIAVFAGGTPESNVVDYFIVAAPAPPSPTPQPPTPPPTKPPTPAPSSSGMGAGDIVLIVLASLIAVFAFAYCLRSKKRAPLDARSPLLDSNAV